MGIFFTIVGVLFALVAGFVLWRIFATVLASQHRTEAVLAEIQEITDALEEGRTPAASEIELS